MPIGGIKVTTDIDRMVDYLGKSGEIESHTLAKTMNVEEPVVKAWAGALESNGLVRIKHKFAKMFLILERDMQGKPVIEGTEWAKRLERSSKGLTIRK